MNPHCIRKEFAYTVGIAGKQQLPNQIRISCDGRRIQHQSQQRAQLRRQLINEPCEQKAGHIADRTRYGGKKKRIFHRDQEDVVLHEQPGIVIPADPARRL